MTGTRRITGPKRQLPEWMVQNKPYVKSMSNPDRKPSWFMLAKEFESPKSARRFANLMEEQHHRTKLIEIMGDNPKKPVHYRVYIRETRK